MPKQTFNNLSEEKRKKILAACFKEFSINPLPNALVANIIVDAEIPRGSFYQYFKDIEDAFYYILEQYAKKIKKNLIDNLKENDGDIVDAFHQLYLYTLDMITETAKSKYFKNIFLHMNYKTKKVLTPNFSDSLNTIITLVKIDNININSKFGLGYILEILESVMMHNLTEVYNRNYSKEKNIEIFEKELELIKNGILKL